MPDTASTMQGLVLHGPGDLRLDEVPKPTAFPGSVVVQVIAAPLWDYVVSGHCYTLVYGKPANLTSPSTNPRPTSSAAR